MFELKYIMKKLFIFLSIIVVFISCEKEDGDLPSTYPNLNGSYTFSSYESWDGGLYEISKYESWDFNQTRTAFYYNNNWSYTRDGWWNALKQGISFTKEWKVENGVFYEKLLDNQYSDWTSHSFEYIDNNSFILDGKQYNKD
jgi:hypothetical protein